MIQSAETRAAAVEVQELRERRNWFIHQLYVRQEYVECLSVIEAQLRETEGTCEYALYVKGLLRRAEGNLTESLVLLQAAALVAPENMSNKKQLGRGLFLLGRHEEAMAVFEEAEVLRQVKNWSLDWELQYCIGVCHTYLKNYTEATDAFLRSISAQRQDRTFLALAKVLIEMGEKEQAMGVLTEALALSPENTEMLAMLGALFVDMGQPARAFDYLGQCLTYDPRNTRAIMAASSIIQDGGDYDVALSKYRVAIQQLPDSPQLWNNIGACFFGKRKYYAAVACLRKSLFLFPFDWIPNYNLGIVYLTIGRHTSAFHHLSAAISMQEADVRNKIDGDDTDVFKDESERRRKRAGGAHPSAYMFLGVCLSLLNDTVNACRAYERALSLEDDILFRLNYAITLWNSGMAPEAAEQFAVFKAAWESLPRSWQRQQPASIPATYRVMDALLTGASGISDGPATVASPPLETERDTTAPSLHQGADGFPLGGSSEGERRPEPGNAAADRMVMPARSEMADNASDVAWQRQVQQQGQGEKDEDRNDPRPRGTKSKKPQKPSMDMSEL